MDPRLVERLCTLNLEFYASFAQVFSDSRPANRTNLSMIMPHLHHCVKLLDVGCGNGRLANRLDEERLRLRYTGIDATQALLAIASKRTQHLEHVHADFLLVDIARPGWAAALRSAAPFDAAVALAVLHHIPSFQLRQAVMQQLRALLQADGILVLSNWQFERSLRLRKKIVPWQSLGIDERSLEPGDVLLDWRRGGRGYRYCHLLAAPEIEALAGQSGFEVLTQFEADAGLNLYSVLQRAR